VSIRITPRSVRWLGAFALLLLGATAFIVSNITDHLQSCSTLSDLPGIPAQLRGAAAQGLIRFPVRACAPVPVWVMLPFAALAILLILPDYVEVGLGGFALKRFESQINERLDRVSKEVKGVRSSLSTAAGITKDEEAGTVSKGTIRNVELRIQTVQGVLLDALAADPTDKAGSLYRAGFNWGRSWSQDFLHIEDDVDLHTKEGISAILEEWSYYDATAGMGKINFQCDPESGLPVEAEIRNGFLSIERDGIDLRSVMAGYLAGSLDGLLATLGAHYRATITEKTMDRDVYSLEQLPA